MAKVKLTYIGKRLNGEAITHAFTTEENKTLYFKNIPYCILGHIYEADKEKDGYSMKNNPVELGVANVDEDTMEQWRVEELLAHDFIRRKRTANKIRKSPAIERAAAILKPLCKELYGSQINALVEAVVDEIRKEEREALNSQIRDLASKIQKGKK